MGGPCDAPFHGNSADEVIKAQDNHLKEMVAGGDETVRGHEKVPTGGHVKVPTLD
jgi:hypothetical protein